MTVIRPNSISGVTSITALQNSIEFYKSDGSLSGANIDGISINTAGIITANTFYGNGSNLTGITGTTINNNANNRLITGSGTANTLEGEANLTWNGQTFEAYNASGPSYIAAKSNTNSGDYGIVQVQSGSTVRGRLVSDASVDAFRLDTAGRASAPITFHTGSSYTERLRIDSSGNVILKTANAAFKSESSSSGDYVRLYAGSGTGKWDIYGNGQYLRISDNDSAGSVRLDTRLGVGSAASHAQLCSLTSGTGAIPTTGLIQTNNSNHALQLWNTDNSATYCGLMLETRTSGASGWLIANEWKSTYAGDLVFRGRNGGSSSEERLRITVAGNLQAAGITTSNTGFMFGTGGQHFLYQSAADTATLRITSDGPYVEFKDVSGDVQMGSASGTLRLSAGGNEKVRITSSEVKFTANQTFAANNTYYIGTNSNKLARNYSTKFIHREGTGSSVNGGGQNAEVIMFDGGGITMLHDNVTLTTAGPFSSMTCSRAGALLRMRNNGGPAIVSENGSITAAGASDYRIKENIVGITSAMSTMKKLNPVSYNIKKSWNPDDKGDRMQGFLAHEIQEAITDNVGIVYGKKDAVNSDGSIDTQVMEYGKLTPVLTAAIKELIAKVETLEAEVATLKGS